MNNNETKKAKGPVIITLIITIIALAMNIDMMIVQGSSNPWNLLSFIILVLVFVYIIVGYKKPHGNMLRYCMLVYAFYLGIYAVNAPDKVMIVQNLMLASAVLVAYMSGRLHKIEKNRIVSIVIGILLIAAPVIMFVAGLTSFGSTAKGAQLIAGAISYINLPIQWCGLAVSYFIRFEEHKQAGADK